LPSRAFTRRKEIETEGQAFDAQVARGALLRAGVEASRRGALDFGDGALELLVELRIVHAGAPVGALHVVDVDVDPADCACEAVAVPEAGALRLIGMGVDVAPLDARGRGCRRLLLDGGVAGCITQGTANRVSFVKYDASKYGPSPSARKPACVVFGGASESFLVGPFGVPASAQARRGRSRVACVRPGRRGNRQGRSWTTLGVLERWGEWLGLRRRGGWLQTERVRTLV
jgi:hypothetical protein